jgi:hypothetical protein
MLDKSQRVLVCASRRYAKQQAAVRADGSTHCIRRAIVRKLAMKLSSFSPADLNRAESALIKKGLVRRESHGRGTQCLVFTSSSTLVPCARVLRGKRKPKPMRYFP